jgi:hypothetical protein
MGPAEINHADTILDNNVRAIIITPSSDGFGTITISRASSCGMASAAAERHRAIAMASAMVMAGRLVVEGRSASTCRAVACPAGVWYIRHVCRLGQLHPRDQACQRPAPWTHSRRGITMRARYTTAPPVLMWPDARRRCPDLRRLGGTLRRRGDAIPLPLAPPYLTSVAPRTAPCTPADAFSRPWVGEAMPVQRHVPRRASWHDCRTILCRVDEPPQR